MKKLEVCILFIIAGAASFTSSDNGDPSRFHLGAILTAILQPAKLTVMVPTYPKYYEYSSDQYIQVRNLMEYMTERQCDSDKLAICGKTLELQFQGLKEKAEEIFEQYKSQIDVLTNLQRQYEKECFEQQYDARRAKYRGKVENIGYRIEMLKRVYLKQVGVSFFKFDSKCSVIAKDYFFPVQRISDSPDSK